MATWGRGPDQHHYVRPVAFDRLDDGEGRVQMLLERDSGATTAKISAQRSAPGSSSPRGLHDHTFDHNIFIFSGTMHFEIAGEEYTATANDFVVIQAGTKHRNWVPVDATEPVIWLSILTPLPAYGETRESAGSYVAAGEWHHPEGSS
jgi:quercetin dioxygenase-like cupin family protein